MTQASDRGQAVGVWDFVCSACKQPHPATGFPHRCPRCGGLYDFGQPLRFLPSDSPPASHRGIGRFRDMLPLPPGAKVISLGEGGTPLLLCQVGEKPIHFKCEHLNPTGSFKDRGSAALVSALLAGDVQQAVEDSSGNAGASFAAYAARAGIKARVFVPACASGPKRMQIEAYGAELVPVPGPRSAAAEAVLQAVEAGAVYASHVFQPHGLAGLATIAFEIVEQLGGAAGSVIAPVGQGTLMLGVAEGFGALQRAGVIPRMPRLIGVQARACAPLWAVHTGGASKLEWVMEGETLAEGIRVLRPPRGDAVLGAVERSGGSIIAVEEGEIREGRAALARLGLYVEATSAVVWAALRSLGPQDFPAVVILTGSGFKDALKHAA